MSALHTSTVCRDFTGLRNEEDYLITADGARRLGKYIPVTTDEVEALR